VQEIAINRTDAVDNSISLTDGCKSESSFSAFFDSLRESELQLIAVVYGEYRMPAYSIERRLGDANKHIYIQI
jgi:hypothetical protein